MLKSMVLGSTGIEQNLKTGGERLDYSFKATE